MKLLSYFWFSDNRILEYKFDTVLFNKQSEFQQIQIVETQDFGRLLILNEYANLAENDRVEYTHTLMNLPHENYGVNIFSQKYYESEFSSSKFRAFRSSKFGFVERTLEDYGSV